MRSTNEQREATEALEQLARPYRVIRDDEGWPYIPGRKGRIEWYDDSRLAVYTDRPRMVEKLMAIPGVQQHQRGDNELRAVFRPGSLEDVAGVIRARRRRFVSPDRRLRLNDRLRQTRV